MKKKSKNIIKSQRFALLSISQQLSDKYSSLFSGKITEDISKTAKDAAESIADTSSRLGQTSAFKTISQVKYLCYIFT